MGDGGWVYSFDDSHQTRTRSLLCFLFRRSHHKFPRFLISFLLSRSSPQQPPHLYQLELERALGWVLERALEQDLMLAWSKAGRGAAAVSVG